jgi:hypothetical protein
MQQAEVQRPARRPATERRGLLTRVRLGWPAAAGALGTASVAALAFAAVLQFQLSDIRDENDGLEARVEQDAQVLNDMKDIMSVAISEDLSTTELAAASVAGGGAGTAIYGWSRKQLSGFVICKDMPPANEGHVYQAWFHAGDMYVTAGTFEAQDGTCQLPVELSSSMPLSGFGISVEPEGGSTKPSSDWLMYADFGRD